MTTPRGIDAIEQQLMFEGLQSVPAGDVLAIIAHYRRTEHARAQLAVDVARAGQTIANVQLVIGGGPVPAEWSRPWRLRAERAEHQLGLLAGIRRYWASQLESREYQLTPGGLAEADTTARRQLLQRLLADVDEVLSPGARTPAAAAVGTALEAWGPGA